MGVASNLLEHWKHKLDLRPMEQGNIFRKKIYI